MNAAMNPEVERFFDECRAEPWYRTDPEVLEKVEEDFRLLYALADHSPARQREWDRITDIVQAKDRSLSDRLRALAKLLENPPNDH